MSKPILLAADLSPEAFAELSARDEVGIDCEMMGLNPGRDRLCLVQIAAEKSACYIVQIDEANGAPRLKELLENAKIIKIFHFARTDLQFLQVRVGIRVQNIYCTKIASRLSRTYTDKHGLKELVREIAGENIDKSSQSSDWGRADLSAEQVRYAADDVKYLFRIKRTLAGMLEREGRTELARQFMNFLPTLVEADRLGYPDILQH